VSTGRAKWQDHFHDGLGQNDWGIRSVMIHEPTCGIRVQYILTLGISLFGWVGRWGWGAF
jgi:hypothetical protein